MRIDSDANEHQNGERKISSEDSSVEVFVIPANEEYMVVNETYKNCTTCK